MNAHDEAAFRQAMAPLHNCGRLGAVLLQFPYRFHHTLENRAYVRRRDKYGRTLAYVHVGTTMLNAELVRQGYGQVATFPPNVRHQERFLALQREAREARPGLWGP